MSGASATAVMSDQPSNQVPDLGPTVPDPSKTSRGTSPARNGRTVSAIPQLTRSRKNSQELSPTRNSQPSGSTSTVPSAAAVQRALSAQRPIISPTSVDGVLDGSLADRSMKSGHNSPSWPTSPRLRSPPPKVGGRTPSTKRAESEHTQSNTSVKRLAPASHPDLSAAIPVPEPSKEQSVPTHSALRVPGRGPVSAQASPLETVTEGSVPSTPSSGPVAGATSEPQIDLTEFDRRNEARSDTSPIRDGEGSGGEAPLQPPADKAENGRPSRPAADLAKRSFTSLKGAKNKAAEPLRTMTVETETVTSMPQLLGPDRGVSGRDGSGSVRTKPSNETIRPKKEKKRPTRKPPSLHAGTGTSKADIFEARVASAVDEAASSDSDETFVYESNPPDSRPSRHHSRTPSATSLASQDQYGGRNKHGVRSGSQAIAGKKSMKFSSNAYNQFEAETGTEGRGSTRTASSTPRHHHINRHGRPAHPSLFDTDSPFTQANRPNSPRTASNNPRFSRPNSPRVSNGRLPTSPRKGEAIPYDVYEDGADDERTPLTGSVRINRARHSRRPHSATLRRMSYTEPPDRSYCGRWGGCIFLAFVVVLISVGVTTFVVGLNQPLMDVSIKHLQNVLASEQELMLDLHVEAINTNLFAITVSDLDVNLFAESPYVGPTADGRGLQGQLRWATRRQSTGAEADDDSVSLLFPPFHVDDGVDEGTDPIDDPEPGAQKMLLGRILEFDSPLVFEAAPFRHSHSSSVGEIRLAKPGNKTELGGSARWERVIQHQFDLIVRGVLKYQLPLSSKTRSAKIGSRITVFPNEDTGGEGST